jgi:hypothetical protein
MLKEVILKLGRMLMRYFRLHHFIKAHNVDEINVCGLFYFHGFSGKGHRQGYYLLPVGKIHVETELGKGTRICILFD